MHISCIQLEMNCKFFTTDILFIGFKNLIMEFTYDHVYFVLIGLTSKKLVMPKIISTKTLENAVQLCLL